MRCLEKLPADRFSGADEVVAQLEGYIRARTGEKSNAIVLRTLVAAGLVEGEAGTNRWQLEEKGRPLGMTFLGFAAITLAFAGAGGLLQWNARGARAAAQAGSKPLELAPAAAGGLRVMAFPWAEVSVDGQRIDVTPIGRPLPLPPGPHFVILTHPNAPPEKRAITIATGETTTLDVAMKIGALDGDGGIAAGRRGERNERGERGERGDKERDREDGG